MARHVKPSKSPLPHEPKSEPAPYVAGIVGLPPHPHRLLPFHGLMPRFGLVLRWCLPGASRITAEHRNRYARTCPPRTATRRSHSLCAPRNDRQRHPEITLGARDRGTGAPKVTQPRSHNPTRCCATANAKVGRRKVLTLPETGPQAARPNWHPHRPRTQTDRPLSPSDAGPFTVTDVMPSSFETSSPEPTTNRGHNKKGSPKTPTPSNPASARRPGAAEAATGYHNLENSTPATAATGNDIPRE